MSTRDETVTKVHRSSDVRRAFGDVDRASHNLETIARWWFENERPWVRLDLLLEDAKAHVIREAFE